MFVGILIRLSDFEICLSLGICWVYLMILFTSKITRLLRKVMSKLSIFGNGKNRPEMFQHNKHLVFWKGGGHINQREIGETKREVLERSITDNLYDSTFYQGLLIEKW